MLLALAVATGFGGVPMQQVQYLSDMPDRLVHDSQGWGQLGYDVCAHAAGQKPLPLQIGAKTYRKGLGHHAPGMIVVDLSGQYATFDAEVGVENQPSGGGSVVFSVFVDGKKRFATGVMLEETPAIPVHVDVTGAEELRLVVGDAGDGINCDAANWADARLTVAPHARAVRPRPRFDLVDFAQVCTWDPKRMDGARAARIEEFHAEDVFLDRPATGDGGEGYLLPPGRCIGLVWSARRKPTQLTLEGEHIGKLDPATVQVQAWTGSYPSQGEWKPLVGRFDQSGGEEIFPAGSGTEVGPDSHLDFMIDPKANAEFASGFRKVRWVLPASRSLPKRVSLGAWVSTPLKEASLRLETEPSAGTRVAVDYVNCEHVLYVDPHIAPGKPVQVGVRYPKAEDWDDGPTQPALRFSAKSGVYTVNVKDALTTGVYLPRAGLFLSKPGATLAAYKKRIARKKTVLQRVRQMPDQTLARAMAKTYREVHFGSPTLLSVGPDNWKWLVEPDGSVVWEPEAEVADRQMPFERRRCLAAITAGGERLRPVRTPKLAQGMKRWMPVVQQSAQGCTFTAYAAPIAQRKSLFVGRLDLDGRAPVELAFQSDRNQNLSAKIAIQGSRVLVQDGERLLAVVDLSGVGEFQATAEGGKLRASGKGSLLLAIPGWAAAQADPDLRRLDEPSLARAFTAYWDEFHAEGMRIEIPDPLLSDVIQSSRVRCFVDARNQADGERLAPWIAEIHYGPLESEANTIVRGMALMGHKQFTQRCLDYFIKLYSPQGFLTTGYTLVGTGWHLWTLGEAFALNPDEKWLRRHADEVAKVCRWVIRERHKTMRLVAGTRPPQYGLVTPGVIADWNAYHYYFYTNGTYCAGLEAAGKALQSVGYHEADAFLKEARAYRSDIVAAYRGTQGLTPAVPLQDGTWVPGQPSQIDCPGPLGGYYPGEDGSRSWCYDVEVGPHNLVQQSILPPDGVDSREMADHLEDDMYLRDGWGDYPATEIAKDTFDLGGFSKVQPYYSRLQEVYAMRDDVKPFIRGYFNMIASLVDPSNLTIWEHFDHYGAPDKTHETGVFLQQTRFMLVKERGEELWLAPFVPREWMGHGKVVEVRRAPTVFGDVGFRIESHVKSGYIEARIDPPARRLPKAIILRLRHPEGKRIKALWVDGKRAPSFDPVKETVRLRPMSRETIVKATY